MFDGTSWRHSENNAKDVLGAVRLPSGEPGIVGAKGRVASLMPGTKADSLVFVEQVQGTGAVPELFSVAADSSAWAVRSVSIATDTYEQSLGLWSDASGWAWHVVPDLALGQDRVRAMAPLSKSSVWLTVRTNDGPNPQYSGADKLLHWNGTGFDAAQDAPKSLRALEPDDEGGLFALAVDGGFYHSGADGKLTLLADAGTAGESDYQICTPLIAPAPGVTAWVLDSVCKLSFWNGSTLLNKPTFRSGIHGSGWIDFELAATGEDSLWVTDPQQGLMHFDGKDWKQVWHSEHVPHGIFVADDDHVWLIDAPYKSNSGVLHFWDGKAMRTVGATPHSFWLSGSKDSVWLAGDTSLLRLLRDTTAPN